MRDPDGSYDCMTDAAKDSLVAIEGLSDEEREQLQEKRAEKLRDFAGKWLEYGEYVVVEFDTDAGTAVVVPCT